MRLSVVHETCYHYTSPVVSSIQQVRLYPRAEAHQTVIQWKVEAGSRGVVSQDTFMNTVHTFTMNQAHQTKVIRSHGQLDIKPLNSGWLHEDHWRISPLVFTVKTRLTDDDAAIDELALQTFSGVGSFLDRVMRLAGAVTEQVVYKPGSTNVTSTAIEALSAGFGVCQDHTHVMLACLRSLGIPARYVSGYYWGGFASEFASHAWVDVFDEESQRWVSVDPTHHCTITDKHCRLAIGRDYQTAAPVRGVRSGGGVETLNVNLHLDSAE